MKIRGAIPCFLFLYMSCVCALARTAQTPAGQPAKQSGAAAPSAAGGSAVGNAAGADSHNSSKVAPAIVPVIDPVKEADIRHLLDLAGGTDAINQVMDAMQTNLKTSLTASLPTGAYRERLVNLFFEKFRAKADVQELIDSAVHTYDKYYSDEDVKGLIQFYSTPLGKKTISVLPKVTVEMQTQGMQWGQKLGMECMREVLAEHPDLAKALQDSAKGNAPRQ